MLNWIKKKIRWILISVGILGIALASTLIPAEQKTIEEETLSLKTTIETDLQPNGKYKRRDKEIINEIEYEVHEYETSKGEIGYTIFTTKTEGDFVYKKAEATGVEKASREFDWRIIKDNTPKTATTT